MDFQRTNEQLHMNGGLTRYRSAPSSYFSCFLDAADEAIRNCAAGGGGGGGVGGGGLDELDNFLSRFMPSNSIRNQGQDSSSNNDLSNSMGMQSQSQFVASMKQERETMQSQQLRQQKNQSNYCQVPSMLYQNQSQAPQSQQQIIKSEGSNASSVDNSYRSLNSVRSNRLPPMKAGNGGDNSNLTRYNSSPAGLFANINVENEYGALRRVGNFGAGSNANAEASFSSASRVHGHGDFSSAQATSPGLMPPISEIGDTDMEETNPVESSFVENQKNDSGYMSGFPVNSWDDSTILSESFLKGLEDDHDDNKAVPHSNEAPSRPPPVPTRLSHHLSLPKTSEELSVMETLMQDSVLCKLRAKRGCATHPRSIAERVRRTRISERMRKLQDLVPNMDKQTNTADMLDLAVDYIKDLQKQVQALSDNRAKCTCLNQ